MAAMTLNHASTLVFAALAISGCATTAGLKLPEPLTKTTGPVSIELSGPGYEGADLEKRAAAIAVLEKVLNSSQFEQRIHDFKFNKRGTNGSPGFTSAEVLTIVLSGSDIDGVAAAESDEAAAGAVTRVLKMNLNLDKDRRGELGHTSMETGEIFTGQDWFRSQTICEVAGHALHEYTHVVGFGHTFLNVLRRSRTVPYGLGDTAADLATELNAEVCKSSRE